MGSSLPSGRVFDKHCVLNARLRPHTNTNFEFSRGKIDVILVGSETSHECIKSREPVKAVQNSDVKESTSVKCCSLLGCRKLFFCVLPTIENFLSNSTTVSLACRYLRDKYKRKQ